MQSCSAAGGFLHKLRWKPLSLAGAIAACVYLPIIVSDSDDNAMLYWLVILTLSLGSLVIVLILTCMGKWKNALTLVGSVTVCLLVSFTLFWKSYFVRTSYRWVVHSGAYKQRLLARHGSAPSGITYMDWDGWGFAGSDTEAYLVHDPGDHLKNATHDRYGVKAEGLTCEVWKIRRLEKDWYSVVFFTNEGWNDCTQESAGSH